MFANKTSVVCLDDVPFGWAQSLLLNQMLGKKLAMNKRSSLFIWSYNDNEKVLCH
jgi:hypothetical protein